MKSLQAVAVSLVLCFLSTGYAYATQYSLIVSGLGGEADYETKFRAQAKAVAQAAEHASEHAQVTTLVGEQATHDAIRRAIASIASKATPTDAVAITLIGHGSFDGEEYRFNIPGPDVTASELHDWLQALTAHQQLIVVATSSSGGATAKLLAEHRVVITATKSGTERNATRFAELWSKALTASEADLDKNEWVTVQEAYDYAARKVADEFKASATLATEHARLEGKQAESFPLGRLGATREMPNDAVLIDLFAQRVRASAAVETVKARKGTLAENDYYNELEKVLIALAQTQRRIDTREASLNSGNPSAAKEPGKSSSPPRDKT